MRHRNRTPARGNRRRLSAETLESRALLATLGLGVEFFEVGASTPAASLQVGELYDARIVVNTDDPAVGVISLPLNYSWDPNVLEVADPSKSVLDGASYPLTGSQVPDEFVTSNFPLQRAIEDYDPAAPKFDPSNPAILDSFYNIEGIRGGALPNAGFGSAIALGGTTEAFTEQLRFRVIADINSTAFTTFTIALDGSMSFSNGEALDRVAGISGASDVNIPSVADNQIVQASIPIGVGGTKQEIAASGQQGPPATPVSMVLDFGNDGILTGPNDQTVVTAADGSYRFAIDQPGNYSIQEILPDGRIRLAPANGMFTFIVADDGQITLGENVPLDFLNQVVTLSGTKFEDLSDSGTIGVRDPTDPPLAGVTITLDINNDGATTPDETTVTAADGSYQFTEVPQGTHRVFETAPVGTIQTFPAEGSYVVSVSETTVTVDPNVATDALDFGNQTIQTSIAGTKRIDTNNNGMFDDSDAAQPGVRINLDINNDGIASNDLSTLTDVNGRYRFADVPPGTHSLREVVPDGFRNVLPGAGGYTIVVGEDRTVTPEGDLNFLNAPRTQMSSISGYVYTDNNLDGIKAPSELGLPGVTVRLIDNSGTTIDTTNTGLDGWYNFERIEPGTYSVEEVQPANFVDASISLGQVFPSGTVSGNTNGLNRFHGIVIDAGQQAVEYNFGENLGRVTKRMVLARGDIRSEMFDNAGIRSTTVSGTNGDDIVRIDQTNDNWRISINGQTRLVPLVQSLIVDTGSGSDVVQVIGTSSADEVHIQQNQLAFSSGTASGGLLVVGAEQMTADGRRGDDLVVIEGSNAADQLTAAGDSAVLRYAGGDVTAEGLAFNRIRANNPAGSATNQASVAAIDFALTLVGDWNQ